MSPETELSQRLKAGDHSALAESFDRLSGGCMALAVRLLHDRSLAEDTVQEVFLHLWRNPDGFDPTRGALRSYLMTMTHHRAVDLIRREANRRRVSDSELERLPADTVEVADQVSATLDASNVRQALSTLPEPQQQVLLLAYYRGYTQREIAAITGVPLGTVKTRMLAAVRRLRPVLAERFPTTTALEGTR